MKIINTDVVYIDDVDLFPHARNKNINNINFPDVKDRELIKKSTVVIYRNKKGGFKLLKSKW